MDNFFITNPPYTRIVKETLLFKFVRKALRYLKIGDLSPMIIDPMVDMNTIEQRINYFHLLNNVINNDIEGDVVELGVFTGYCALIFQNVIEQNQSDKKLHLYDSFDIKFGLNGDIQDILIDNFKKAKLNIPVMHKGYFKDTLPSQLPTQISFVHMDCGFGGDALAHKELLLYCLKQVYPKMVKGAICVLMDYKGNFANAAAEDVNPGATLAGEEFLKDKPEKMVALYGNQSYHGYFQKK
jgi:O-methyltransferase